MQVGGPGRGWRTALIFHPLPSVRVGAPSPVVWPRSLIPHRLVISITKPGRNNSAWKGSGGR